MQPKRGQTRNTMPDKFSEDGIMTAEMKGKQYAGSRRC
jgi:hypothetical protein